MTPNNTTQLTGPGMRFHYADSGRSVRPGIFGMVVAMLTMLIGAILFIGALVVITAAFLVAVVAALGVIAIRGAIHALAPRHTAHHVDQGGFRPAAVIETTAKVIQRSAPKPRS